MAEYTQPDAVDRRVRFFDGQFLVDQDFVDEQRYHIDRARRLGKVLRVTGVAEGLAVFSGRPFQVTVAPGTAIDAEGRHLVLAKARDVDVPPALGGPVLRLFIVFREVPDTPSQAGADGHTRWYEDPLVVAVTADGSRSTEPGWTDDPSKVLLAELRLDPKGKVTVDPTPADRAGLRVAGDLEAEAAIRFGGGRAAAVRLSSTRDGVSLFDRADRPRLTVLHDSGNVGIGTTTPRTALDTGTGVMSGAANDYLRAQLNLTGGGTVTWEGPGGRLRWTQRFVATAMARGDAIPEGSVHLYPPDADIPATHVHDGTSRSADASGVVLDAWEGLYAVHRVGGGYTDVDGFRIVRWTHALNAPSNWILVAVVNGEDRSVKLGTGVIVAARSSSTDGSPLPTGAILMWSGTVDTIPEGWALCDGKDGRPDLQSRFVVGAGPGGTPSYGVNARGEPDQHSHAVAASTARLTTESAGSHDHAPPSAWYDRSWNNYAAAVTSSWSGIDRGGGSVEKVRTSSSGSHTHSFKLSGATFDSGESTGHNRPKWYALCFIMKL